MIASTLRCLAAVILCCLAPVAALAQGPSPFAGGKLVLTNGVSTVEGASGGGIATWATIAGLETDHGVGLSGHVSRVYLPDYELRSAGVSLGIRDRVELSFARQAFDTRDMGQTLGLGRGYTFRQDVIGVKVRLIGDTVYGPAALPQISVGAQMRHNRNGAVVRAVGAQRSADTDFTVSATKLILSRSLLVNATARVTRANQWGLLGFGGDRSDTRSVQFEGSAAFMVSPRAVIGAEYRTKPDNLGFAGENDAKDVFVAYAVGRHLTLVAALADLGSIATARGQRGAFLSAQASF